MAKKHIFAEEQIYYGQKEDHFPYRHGVDTRIRTDGIHRYRIARRRTRHGPSGVARYGCISLYRRVIVPDTCRNPCQIPPGMVQRIEKQRAEKQKQDSYGFVGTFYHSCGKRCFAVAVYRRSGLTRGLMALQNRTHNRIFRCPAHNKKNTPFVQGHILYFKVAERFAPVREYRQELSLYSSRVRVPASFRRKRLLPGHSAAGKAPDRRKANPAPRGAHVREPPRRGSGRPA